MGVPLIAAAPPVLTSEMVEAMLGPVMDELARVRPSLGATLERFGSAWDRGEITPASLFPARGRLGSVPDNVWFDPPLLGFLATVSLRPFLDVYFSECRAQEVTEEDAWSVGICPCCGAPPGFSDVAEDGRRRLSCHVCGGTWGFARLRCPFCGNDESENYRRLAPETTDEGYAVDLCAACRAYVKELDRRVRWNGRSALVEDWGSPHLDLVAQRAGFWRPLASLSDLAGGPGG